MKPSENVTPISPLRVEQPTEVNPTVPGPGDEATPAPTPRSDLEAVKALAEAHAQIVREIEKRIIGQRRVIDQLLVALFARGHTLFVGVPGLTKTKKNSTLAGARGRAGRRGRGAPGRGPAGSAGAGGREGDH